MISLKCFVVSFGLASLLVPAGAEAAGQLMVHPTRIVFEGRERTAQIDIINNGTEESTYRISLVRRRMTDTGEFVSVETPLPGEQFSDEMIRFSPRQVTLPPGGGQIVRLQLRRPSDLEPGEYRSHLLFQALPPPGLSRAQSTAQDVEIELTAIVSLSIPVIVRHGETVATVRFANMRIGAEQADNEDLPALEFELQREGNRSVYGDVLVSFTPRGGREMVVGRANGVAVYVPNPIRRARIPLRLPGGHRLAHGRLEVTFTERPESGGRVLADARFDLP